ncbi:hypothetical protein [Novipirellula sp.]|uniref:hypothetical protein n=1 Tax=Novipirellula sp. TaxID=2795430 RepID=UPI0035668C39
MKSRLLDAGFALDSKRNPGIILDGFETVQANLTHCLTYEIFGGTWWQLTAFGTPNAHVYSAVSLQIVGSLYNGLDYVDGIAFLCGFKPLGN